MAPASCSTVRILSLTSAPLRNRTVDLLPTMTTTLRPDPPASTNSTAGSTECPDRTEEAPCGFHDRFHADHQVGHREGSRTVAGQTGAPGSSASHAATARTAWVAFARSSGCPLTPVRPGHGAVRLILSEDGEPIASQRGDGNDPTERSGWWQCNWSGPTRLSSCPPSGCLCASSLGQSL